LLFQLEAYYPCAGCAGGDLVAITLIPQACFSGTQIAQSASWQTASISTVLKNGQITASPPFLGDDFNNHAGIPAK